MNRKRRGVRASNSRSEILRFKIRIGDLKSGLWILASRFLLRVELEGHGRGGNSFRVTLKITPNSSFRRLSRCVTLHRGDPVIEVAVNECAGPPAGVPSSSSQRGWKKPMPHLSLRTGTAAQVDALRIREHRVVVQEAVADRELEIRIRHEARAGRHFREAGTIIDHRELRFQVHAEPGQGIPAQVVASWRSSGCNRDR